MKLAIVTGSRDWTNRDAIWKALDEEDPNIVIHGHCKYTDNRGEIQLRGADSYADAWARDRGVALLSSPAHFTKRGKKAGPIRNSFVAKAAAALLDGWPGGPHEVVVIAAPLPDSTGTPDMVKKCKQRGWRVRLVKPSLK